MKYDVSNEILWYDRKHYWGLPLSFESYRISGDRLFLTTGLWKQSQHQIELHRIQNLVVTRSFSQRLCGVGTVTATTVSNKVIELTNIRDPFGVKELLYECSEEQKEKKWYRCIGQPHPRYA